MSEAERNLLVMALYFWMIVGGVIGAVAVLIVGLTLRPPRMPEPLPPWRPTSPYLRDIFGGPQ